MVMALYAEYEASFWSIRAPITPGREISGEGPGTPSRCGGSRDTFPSVFQARSRAAAEMVGALARRASVSASLRAAREATSTASLRTSTASGRNGLSLGSGDSMESCCTDRIARRA